MQVVERLFPKFSITSSFFLLCHAALLCLGRVVVRFQLGIRQVDCFSRMRCSHCRSRHSVWRFDFVSLQYHFHTRSSNPKPRLLEGTVEGVTSINLGANSYSYCNEFAELRVCMQPSVASRIFPHRNRATNCDVLPVDYVDVTYSESDGKD